MHPRLIQPIIHHMSEILMLWTNVSESLHRNIGAAIGK